MAGIRHATVKALGDSDTFTDWNADHTVGLLDFTDFSELTISGGAVTVTQTCHTIDTEANAASDDLDTISGGSNGAIIIIRAENDARAVVVKHNMGNVWLRDQADVNLDDVGDGLELVYDGTRWFAVAASHAAATVAGAPLTLAGQAITFNKSATHFDLSGNDLILKATGHGAAEHDATSLDTAAKLLAASIRPTYNRLAEITATFDTFDTNPTSAGNMTDGDWTTETGEGIKSLAGANGTVGQIYFDMGALYPVAVMGWVNAHRASGDGLIWARFAYSSDGITYTENADYPIVGGVAGDAYRGGVLVPFHTRYIRVRFFTTAVTVNPSVFHVKVAEVMALQLL